MITDKTIEVIQDAVDTAIVTVKGEEFVTRPVFRKPLEQFQKEPQPATLALHSLTALVAYVEACLSSDEEGFVFLHVESPTKVSLLTALYGESQQRDTLVTATYDCASFPWGAYQNNEEFLVFMQARFEPSGDQAKVLKVVGNIKEEAVRQTSDDGTTQTVVAKAGIVRAEDTNVPNPVSLAPFRTFPEVEQPESPFVLRLKSGQPLPQCALFEADGGAWANVARENVRAFLSEKLPKVCILA